MTDLERLCRVLCKASSIDPDSSYGVATFGYGEGAGMKCGRYEEGWDHENPDTEPRCPSGRLNWTWFEEDVRAILTELRAPSESMSLAGKAAYATTEYPNGLDAAFTAMIDHVLEEKPE